MKSDVSALLDGALDEGSSRRLLETMRDDRLLREAWDDYCLIGDVIRRRAVCAPDFTARVMRRLDDLPTVVAPMARPGRLAGARSAWAVAASLAAVGVVAWVVAGGEDAGRAESAELKQAAVKVVQGDGAARNLGLAATSARPSEAALPLPNGAVIPYLVVHQGYGSGGGMQGVAPYVRAVSESRQDSSR